MNWTRTLYTGVVAIALCCACGGSSDGKIDAKAVCKHIAKVLDQKVEAAALSECEKRTSEQGDQAGAKAFKAYESCVLAAKDIAGLTPCETAFAKAGEATREALDKVKSRVYAKCSELGQAQVLLERTDDEGGKSWGFECHDSVMKVYKGCEAEKAEQMLSCLDGLVDPDELGPCVAKCK